MSTVQHGISESSERLLDKFRYVMPTARVLAGLLLCLLAALVCARLFVHSPWQNHVPLAFVVVLVILAACLGALVGTIGAVLAALVFSYFLYPPLGNIQVDSAAARESLAWMLLAAGSVSFLAFPPKGRSHRSPKPPQSGDAQAGSSGLTVPQSPCSEGLTAAPPASDGASLP